MKGKRMKKERKEKLSKIHPKNQVLIEIAEWKRKSRER